MVSCLPKRKKQVVLDLATGTGDVALALAESDRVSKVHGLDLSRSMLEVGQQKLKASALRQKINLAYGDALNTGYDPDTFDAVTISFGIRNVIDVSECLLECHRVLNKGGRLVVLESGRPDSVFFSSLNKVYVKFLLPVIGRLLSGHKEAYSYLNETVLEFPSGSCFLHLMKEAGFRDLQRTKLLFGSVQLYRGTK